MLPPLILLHNTRQQFLPETSTALLYRHGQHRPKLLVFEMKLALPCDRILLVVHPDLLMRILKTVALSPPINLHTVRRELTEMRGFASSFYPSLITTSSSGTGQLTC